MEDGSPDGAIIVPATDSAEQSVSFTIELGRNKSENEHALERYTDFEKWLWTECLKSSALNAIKLGKKRSFELLCTCEVCHEVYWSRDKHCSCCHGTFESSHKLEVKFSQHVLDCEEKKRRRDPSWRLQGPTRALPSRIQLLKAEIAAVEASVPYEALKSFWTDAYRKSWGLTLKSATSSAELLQIFTQLEAAVNQDWLSSSFETTKELLSVVSQDSGVDEDLNFGEVTVLPWIPHTTAAVALRLMAFDDALSYGSDKKEHQRTNESEEDFNTVQSNATVVRTIEELEAAENLPQAEEDKKEDTWTDSGNGRSNGRSRGRGRGRGGRGGRGSALRTELGIGCFNKDTKQKLQFSEEGMSVTNEDQKAGRGRARRGRARGRGRGRGTRSVRHRQAGIQQGEKREKDSDHLSSIDIGKHKQVYEEIDEEDQSEDSQSEEGEEWEGQNGFGEAENYADNHHYNDEEDNALESSENEDDIDDACEDRQATDDEFEDEDVKYEDDYYGRDGEVEESEGDEAGEIVVESGDEEEEDDEESSSESSKDSD